MSASDSIDSVRYQKLYTSTDGVLVRHLRQLLAERGIEGEIISGIEGVTSLKFSASYDLGLSLSGNGYDLELWVQESDFSSAYQLLQNELNKIE